MGSIIVTETISSVVDQRIGLQNSFFARPHGISSWNTLRIGIRLQMENTGANLSGNPHIFFGLCCGTSAPMGSAIPTHAVGWWTNPATWVYTAASGSNLTYYAGNTTNSCAGIVTVKGVTTASGVSAVAVQFNFPADPTAATRRMVFTDIFKGSPNYTFRVFIPNAAVAAPDVLNTDFLAQLVKTTPSFTNHTYGASSGAVAVNEAVNGTLDCVNIWWNRSVPKIHICDLALYKLA